MSQLKDNQQARLTMSRRKTQEEFVEELKKLNNNIEVLGQYVTIETPILIRYRDCGHTEEKKPIKALAGHGCIQCRFEKMSKTKTKSTEQFVKALREKGIDYIEPIGEYQGVGKKITVKNTRCGHTYEAKAGNILNKGSGCPKCYGYKTSNEFAEIINKKYFGRYEILEPFTNNATKILVRHIPCGYEWKTSPKDLLSEERCPECNISKGEKYIERYLINHLIPFQMQFTFEDCKDKNKLPFDFMVLINGKLKLIEFDGEQHFNKNSKFYNETNVKHDLMKNSYCETHNIPLLRIKYTALKDGTIEQILDNYCK